MSNYAIVGGGRLARHFSQYFHLLEITHNRWCRDPEDLFNTSGHADAEWRLSETIETAECVLLLVSDNAIGRLLRQYPFLHEKQLIHCSGALSIPGMVGVHPLMTFAEGLYDLQTYQSIPFIIEKGHDFDKLFPDLPNPHFSVNVEDKARYHALCVMAGNFAQLLWKGVSDRFDQQFALPPEVLHPYFEQLVTNFKLSPETALTGPLTRADTDTIERNLSALKGDSLQDLYEAFMGYQQVENRQGNLREQIS